MNNRTLGRKWALRYSLAVLVPGLLLGAALALLVNSQANALAQIPEAKAAAESLKSTVTLTLILVGAAVLLTTGLVLWLTGTVGAALRRLGDKADHLVRSENWEIRSVPAANRANDPLHALDGALESLNGHLIDLDRAINWLESGGPASPGERCGETPLTRRVQQAAAQHQTVQAAVNAGFDQWNRSAGQLGESAASAGQAAGQLQQVTGEWVSGLHQQVGAANRCTGAVQQADRALQQADQAHDSQQQAIEQVTATAEQVHQALETVAGSVGGVQQALVDTAQITQSGTDRVLQTINGIERIRKQVNQLGEKMSALGQGSNEIGSIVGTIEEIASQTNLLAINATIEAAHAESQAHQLTETLLNRFMIGQARLVRKLIESGMEGQPPAYWSEIAGQANIDSIYATNEDGVTVLSNDPAGLGFRFPDDPNAQAFVFRQLLKQKDGELCQPPQRRSLDNQIFKYVGVSRRDRPGIVQVGFNTSSLAKFELQIGGFTVVAGEVYQLADRARGATGEIRNLIKHMQKIIGEAVAAMHTSTGEVDDLTQSASAAGSVLQDIQDSFENVLRLAGQATSEIGAVRQIIGQFSGAIEQILATSQLQAETGQAARQKLQDALAGLRELDQTGDQNAAAGEEALRVLAQLTAKIEEFSERVNEAVLATDQLYADLVRTPSGGLGTSYESYTTANPSKSSRLGITPVKPLPLPES